MMIEAEMSESSTCGSTVGDGIRSTRCRLLCSLKIAGVVALGLALLFDNAWAGPRYKVDHFFGAGGGGGGLWGRLALGSNGNLYGTTIGGGAHDDGTVFELIREGDGSWTETVLHSFDGNDGDFPFAGLVLGRNGKLYGTAHGGGPNAAGTVFQLTPGLNGWVFSVLSQSGSHANLIMDKAGNLYGPIGPGKYYEGAVTELVRGSKSWKENLLYSFCSPLLAEGSCPDGAVPFAEVVFDAAGNLYGTTEFGGIGKLGGLGGGTAFQLKHKPDGTWQHILLHSFPSFPGDGQIVYAGLVIDKAGNLYGATQGGGGASSTGGTIFKLSRNANGQWKETILYRFPKAYDGNSPGASLVFDKAGNLYGTTALGGINACSNGCGVVFKLTPLSNGKWKYTVVHRLKFKDGANPAAALILDEKGNLYGPTTLGGKGGYGVVFEITP